jgi:hypothetical protein
MPATKTRPPSPAEVNAALTGIETRAREDFGWTCSNLLWIKPEDRPLVHLDLISTQRWIWQRYLQPAWDRQEPVALVILKSRRARVSTLFEAWFYHKARWYPGQSVLIAAHLDRSVQELYEMILRFHEHLPVPLKPKPKALNRQELAYEHLDSSISVVAARYMDVSRGQLINHCHIAEAPRLVSPETILSGLSEAIPSRGRSSLILEGTADESSLWFREFWDDVGRRQGQPHLGGRRWQRCFIPWFAHPDYRLPVPRGFELTDEERDMQRRHGLTTAQVVWYRVKREEMETLHPGRGKYIMLFEHPSTDEDAFTTSASTIFPPELMDPLKDELAEPRLGFRIERQATWQWRLAPCAVREASLHVWEAPQAGYTYALGVDVASGTGRHESTIVVVRMPGFVQVAEWGDAEVSSADLAGIVAAVCRYYAVEGRGRDVPYVNIDITGGWGMSTNSLLSEVYSGEPFQLYIWEAFDRLTPAVVTGAAKTGWLFTWVSKNVLISTAANLMRERLCVVPSASIQRDLGRLQEEHLGKRVTVEMSGHDRATAWLLAVVCAWRKIARWSWPMAGVPEEKPQAPWRDPATYDTTYASIFETPTPHGSTGGDRNVPWLTQI